MAGVLFDTYDNWTLIEKFWLWPQKICQINRFGLSTPLATLLHVVHCIITLTNTFIPLLSYQYLSRLMTKPTKWHVCPTKTQVSLGVCPVWSESSLSAWRKLGSSATIKRTAKTDQTGQMPRLIWVFAGRTCHFVGFVMRQLIYYSFYPKICHKNLENGFTNKI